MSAELFLIIVLFIIVIALVTALVLQSSKTIPMPFTEGDIMIVKDGRRAVITAIREGVAHGYISQAGFTAQLKIPHRWLANGKALGVRAREHDLMLVRLN